MKIERISCYPVTQPLRGGGVVLGDGRVIDCYHSNIIEIKTDGDLIGYGEGCTISPQYLPSFGEAVREGFKLIAPDLVGDNPLHIGCINDKMDKLLKGNGYIKNGIDCALWDILGKACGQSVCTLLGGPSGNSVDLYRMLCSHVPSDEMLQQVVGFKLEGFKVFQMKSGCRQCDVDRVRSVRNALDDDDTLIVDGNGSWIPREAKEFVNKVEDLNIYIEEPCGTYEQNLSLRRKCNLPLILDESIDTIHHLSRAVRDDACDAINMKIGKWGGLTPARKARDYCVAMGVAMTIENLGGGDLGDAAVAALAHSTNSSLRVAMLDSNSLLEDSLAFGKPSRQGAIIKAPTGLGFGVDIETRHLYKPYAVYSV